MNVRAMPNERFVYEVQSETHPRIWYRVDLVSNRGAMRCACTDWNTRRQPALDKGAPMLTKETMCKHCTAVAWAFLREVLPELALTEDRPRPRWSNHADQPR